MNWFSTLLCCLMFTCAASSTSVQELSTGNNLFTASLYNEIAKTDKDNILLSPFSAEVVLALTQSGAKDGTAEEIRTALHLPKTEEKIENAFKTVLTNLKNGGNYSLQTANKIYVKNNFFIKESFKKISVEVYESETENIDFSKSVQAANIINKWVAEHTNNKIQDLVDPKALDPNTVVFLVNALHFKDTWKLVFNNQSTRKEVFYNNSFKLQVDTMHLHQKQINYFEDEELDAKFLQLFFRSGNVSLVIALPNKRDGINFLQSCLNKVFTQHPFKREFVNVALPKFKIEKRIYFTEILKNLGVIKAFSPTEADFSGISGKKGNLYVNNVVQKTFIDVNENGVEAAAATAVGVIPLSVVDNPKEFVADHPFIFYLQFENLILFAGRVTSPEY